MQKSKWMLDIDDGGLLEFMSPYLDWYNKRKNTSFRKEDIFVYDMWKPIGITEEEMVQDVNLFYETSNFRVLPRFSGALEFLTRLKEKAEYIAITSRPESTERATDVNLYFRFNSLAPKVIFAKPYTPLLGHNGNKGKAELCLERGIKYAVEDSVKHANALAKVGIRVYLLPQPWNIRENDLHENIVRVNSLKQIPV